MKTALQELKEQINHKLSLFQNIEYDDLSLHQRGLLDAYINCKEWVNKLEEKEKQDLIDAYDKGFNKGLNNGILYSKNLDPEWDSGEDYYNETFNS